MAFQIRNPDGSETPAGNASDTTQDIETAVFPLLISNIGLELTIAELLRLAPDQLSQADRNLLMHIAAYLVDFTITTQEVWNTATDAQLTVLDPNDAAATQAIGLLAAGSVPTLTGWASQVTTTENRVVIARIPLANNAEDYRIHAVQGSTTTDQRLQYVTERARNSQYKFISTLSTEHAGTFTAQHHGTVQHTEYDGNIGARGIAQAQELVDALLASILERLLPNASGGSVGQIAKIIEQSGEKSWAIGDDERGTGGGGSLSTAQLAKLAAIATPPAEGERDRKGLIYDGNVTGWFIFDYLTRSEFRDYRPHTPDRGDTLPAHLLPQGTFVLQKTSHWSDKFYRFYPVWRNIDIGGQTHRDIGTIEVPISSEWTVFESTDNPNPAIFSATRVAGMVYRQTSGPVTGYRWYPKIILDRALFPEQSGAYDYSGLSIRMRTDFGSHFDTQLFQTTFDADDQTGSVTEIVAGGKTYVCFRPNPNAVDARTIFDNVVTNDTWLSFQILKSKSASPVFPPTDPQFLSDDPATPWVDGDEFETGLYEGDANGHPQARILPPLTEWNSLRERTIPYFSGTGPDPRAGVDGQFWSNLRTGEVYQKQSGTWTLIADIVLQAELNAVIAGISAGNVEDWDDIAVNTQIGVGTMVEDTDLFYICWTAHRKSTTRPSAAEHQWRLITNYLGGWRSGTYPAGVLAFRSGSFYVSTRAITTSSPSPTGSNGSDYWAKLDVQAEPPRYAKFGINTGLTIPANNATPLTLTIPSSLINSNEATGHITRPSSGDGVQVGAGSYEAFIRLTLATPSDNQRSNLEFDAFDGTRVLDTDNNVGYIRSLDFLETESALARLTFTVSTSTKINFRVRFDTVQGESQASVANVLTAANGYIHVKKL